jgi:hypothetical protein
MCHYPVVTLSFPHLIFSKYEFLRIWIRYQLFVRSVSFKRSIAEGTFLPFVAFYAGLYRIRSHRISNSHLKVRGLLLIKMTHNGWWTLINFMLFIKNSFALLSFDSIIAFACTLNCDVVLTFFACLFFYLSFSIYRCCRWTAWLWEISIAEGLYEFICECIFWGIAS